MRTWNYIELFDSISGGITEDNNHYKELDIYGWDDNGGFSDVVSLATVRAIHIEDANSVLIEITHHFEDVRSNVTVLRLSRIAKDVLVKEFMPALSEVKKDY